MDCDFPSVVRKGILTHPGRSISVLFDSPPDLDAWWRHWSRGEFWTFWDACTSSGSQQGTYLPKTTIFSNLLFSRRPPVSNVNFKVKDSKTHGRITLRILMDSHSHGDLNRPSQSRPSEQTLTAKKTLTDPHSHGHLNRPSQTQTQENVPRSRVIWTGRVKTAARWDGLRGRLNQKTSASVSVEPPPASASCSFASSDPSSGGLLAPRNSYSSRKYKDINYRITLQNYNSLRLGKRSFWAKYLTSHKAAKLTTY